MTVCGDHFGEPAAFRDKQSVGSNLELIFGKCFTEGVPFVLTEQQQQIHHEVNAFFFLLFFFIST